MKFSDLDLYSALQQGIDETGYTECTPVQEQTLPYSLAGDDVAVQSQTGTGKTAAFVITILQRLEKSPGNKKALIIAPTRELAVQIQRETLAICRRTSFDCACIYGGVGYQQQEKWLAQGTRVLVGTPGRLIDLNRSGKLKLDDIAILVIDEADRLFDMGFLPDLRKLLRKMPDRGERQTMLFSATLDTRARRLAWEYMHEPVEIELSPENITVEEVTQELYHVANREKMRLLLGILRKQQAQKGLIFTNTKHSAIEISERLRVNGFDGQFIIGDLPQRKRQRIMDDMKRGCSMLLVATDVAARGIHIDDLPLVINYDLPEDPELYVHRIGRTARAGKEGKAITLACERYVYSIEAIEALINMKIPVLPLSPDLFSDDQSAGMVIRTDRLRQGRSGAGQLDSRRRNSREVAQRRGGNGRAAVAAGARAARAEAQKPRQATADTPRRERPAAASAPRTVNWGGTSRRDSRSGRDSLAAPIPAGGSQPTRAGADRGASREQEPRTRQRPPAGKPRTVEERLAYYREKYGDNFELKNEQAAPEKRKASLFRRLFSRKGPKHRN